MSYPLVQKELFGDEESDNFWLTTPMGAIPGVTTENTLVGSVVPTPHHGDLLLISLGDPGTGDFDIRLESLAAATTDLIMVVPKGYFAEELAHTLQAARVDLPDGSWLLVAAVNPPVAG
jgi:precorrin-3B methylase